MLGQSLHTCSKSMHQLQWSRQRGCSEMRRKEFITVAAQKEDWPEPARCTQLPRCWEACDSGPHARHCPVFLPWAKLLLSTFWKLLPMCDPQPMVGRWPPRISGGPVPLLPSTAQRGWQEPRHEGPKMSVSIHLVCYSKIPWTGSLQTSGTCFSQPWG